MFNVDVNLGRLRSGRACNPFALKEQNSLQIIARVQLAIGASAPHQVILLRRIPARPFKCKTVAPRITKRGIARLCQLRVNDRRITGFWVLLISLAKLIR
jgi:hypothetical protein